MEKSNKTPEQKSETKKMIITVIFALIAIAAVVCVILFYFNSKNKTNQPGVIKAEVTSLEDVILSKNTIAIPYVQTDIPSVVYTADSAGKITFFEFNGTTYTEIPESGSMDINVPLSNQQIPVSIHYIERDGTLTGFGVFTSDSNAGVYIYDFMLCKITTLPTAYEQAGKCLLLVNTDMAAVYSNNPVWEEAYVLDRSSGESTRFLSENNRTLGINGAVRSDFCMITNAEIKCTMSSIPFFSSRAYDTAENAPVDIYIKQGNKETLAVSDVTDKYVKPTDDGGFYYIRSDSNGFSTVKYLNGTQTVNSMFYSQYGEEYIRSGDWLLCKEDGRIYCTYNDTIIETPDFKINPTQFIVSDDGKFVVMAGTVANAMDYQIYIYNIETGKSKAFADKDYTEHKNLFFSSATTACYYTQSTAGYNTVVIDLSKIS